MTLRRTLLASATGLALLGVGLPAAHAHVVVEPSTTEAGAYSVLTFAASHGCEGSPTTSFTISIPETIPDVQPTLLPGWEVEKVVEELDEPVTTPDGATLTQHVGKVVYTATEPLEEGYRAAFEVQVKNPDAAGETLLFPTLQLCEEGQHDWAQVAEEGQDPHELPEPAPSYTLTEASEAGHGTGHAGADADAAPAGDEAQASAAVSAAQTSPVPGYLGLGLGLLGAVLGGLALARTRGGRA